MRIIVADDHVLFRDGVRALVDAMPDAVLVGEASDGLQAVAAVAEHRPDVVVMDLRMPQLDGVEATRRLVAQGCETRVLVVSMLEDDGSVFAAMRAGARGYVLKGAGHEELAAAIRAVYRGEAIFGSAIANRMTRYFATVTPTVPAAFPELTPRETEVLQLLAEGLQNAQIARRLSLSAKTVRNHVSAVLGKLQVADRTEAAVRALEAGVRSGPDGP
ncbi:MAG: response regulator transcription factor [Dermatophilaceae bacterium]